MNLKGTARQFEKLIGDNSPAILTGIGVAGALATAYLTGRAAYRSYSALYEAKMMRIGPQGHVDSKEVFDDLLTPKEKFEVVWKLYIPAAGVASFTIAAIVMANRVGNRRTAAFAAAYGLSEKAFSEYRSKVVEKIGENKERKIRDELTEEQVQAAPPPEILIGGEGKSIVRDNFGRYFEMSDAMETLKKAQNDFYYQVLHQNYGSMSEFFNKVGIPPNDISENLGWDNTMKFELDFTAVLDDKGRPVLAFDFVYPPKQRFWKVNG